MYYDSQAARSSIQLIHLWLPEHLLLKGVHRFSTLHPVTTMAERPDMQDRETMMRRHWCHVMSMTFTVTDT